MTAISIIDDESPNFDKNKITDRLERDFSELTRYQIVEQLYAGKRTLVYRGFDLQDRSPVIIKVLRSLYPDFNELVEFRNQYTIAKNLDLPTILQPLSMEVCGNSYALIMADCGGIPLSSYLQTYERNSLPIAVFLNIAIQLADTLHYLYQNRVIHKDIKPANILINPETQQIELIDFSISSLLPREIQEIKNVNYLEGTLAYISPEQTGRMNRGVDYRSDFYALGVTCYQLLTGQLPFNSIDPLEFIHFHLARQPIAIQELNSDIPIVIAEIVSKLMAKNAEDRYQNALGLKHDLVKCLTQLQTIDRIEEFELGTRDITDRFAIPEKLYGREYEVSTLLNAFDRVSSNGKTELMLVAGFSGIGKTAVIQEIHKPIVRQHGYFIKGKYDQFQSNIPFSAFVRAFRDLMGQLSAESDRQLQIWKTEILSVVGKDGQVLIDVIPELEQIIGKQLPAPELAGIAAQNRFNLLIQKFVRVFTTAEHPVVLFLDDLQWADLASLNLLTLLMKDSGHLLILGAYRDNEVSSVHPFMLTVAEIRKSGVNVNIITLQPLRSTDLNRLVADTLNCSQDLAIPLTDLVALKTKGNPFFATQFLKSLYEDGSISFVYTQSLESLADRTKTMEIGGWQCDIAKIKTLAITDNVVEFMALQLRKLPPATQSVLKLAACIGAEFDLHTLAIVCQNSSTDTATALWKGLQENFLIPTTEIYKFFTHPDREPVDRRVANPVYRFLHDRVQQAAYSLIPDNLKQATHLQIGCLLQENEGTKEDRLFDIVGHLNRAQDLMTESKEREFLAQLNLAAGKKARNSTAHAAAQIFLRTGIDLLADTCWQTQYKLTLDLYTCAVEAAYLNGNFDEMEQLATIVLPAARTILDKVEIYDIQIAAQTAQSQIFKAIEIGRVALRQLDIEIPTVPDEAKIAAALQQLNSQLAGTNIEDLIDLPFTSDLHVQAKMKMLESLLNCVYMRTPNLLPYITTILVDLSVRFGNTPSSSVGYQLHGTILYHFFGEEQLGYEFCQLGLKLLDRLNARELKSQAHLRFGGWMQHHREAASQAAASLKEAYFTGRETGDTLSASYGIINHFHLNFLGGVKIDEWESALSEYQQILTQTKQDSAQIYLSLTWQAMLNFRQKVSHPECLNGSAYDEGVMIAQHQRDDDYSAMAISGIYRTILAYSFGKYTLAVDRIAQAQPYQRAVLGMFFVPVFHFYSALAHLALLPSPLTWEQEEMLIQVEIHQTELLHFAQNAPMNHLHKWHLVEAERQRVLGDKLAAIEHYDLAISLAKAHGFLNEEALANELTGRFYWQWGKGKVAQVYMTEAYYCYTHWGAHAKIEDLRTRYPQLLNPILEPDLNASSFAEMTTVVDSTTNSSKFLDLAAMLKIPPQGTGEIELNDILINLITIAITHAGANKCVLMLQSPLEVELQLVAMMSVDMEPQLLPSIPLSISLDVPISLVNTVKHNLSPLLLADARIYSQFAGDPYIARHRTKSILCMPIILDAVDRNEHQDRSIGILYLENNLIVGAFTQDRVKLLQLICERVAMAISANQNKGADSI
jgi:predicted ATPase/GAF domain-containing protein